MGVYSAGTQFTCFTSTKAQILTRLRRPGTHPVGAQGARSGVWARIALLFQKSTYFTSTKVQTLTRLRVPAHAPLQLKVLSLLALLVQKYKH